MQFITLIVDFFDDDETHQLEANVRDKGPLWLHREVVYDQGLFVACIESIASCVGSFMATWRYKYSKAIPIIHIVGHGNLEGIEIRCDNQSVLPWSLLCSMLSVANSQCNGELLAFLSSCEGWSGLRMALGTQVLPYKTLVSPTGRYLLADLNEAYNNLYAFLGYSEDHTESIEQLIQLAVQSANNSASSGHRMLCISGDDILSFGRLLKGLNIKNLTQVAQFYIREKIINRKGQQRALAAFEKTILQLAQETGQSEGIRQTWRC